MKNVLYDLRKFCHQDFPPLFYDISPDHACHFDTTTPRRKDKMKRVMLAEEGLVLTAG